MDYDLQLFGRIESDEGLSGQLSSPLLDPILNPGHTKEIVLESTRSASKRWQTEQVCTIESLQLRSIEQYLRDQAMLRELVESAMTSARRHWLGGHPCTVAEMWSDTKPTELYLPDRELAAIDSGSHHTQTAYTLCFDVGWDIEHLARAVKFRDGEFLGLGMPGD